MTANSLYSNFVDAADVGGNIKNNRSNLEYCSQLAGGIVRYDLYTELNSGAVYPILGGTAFSAKLNFMNPVDSDAAKRLTYINGAFTHTPIYIKRSTADTRLIDTHILPSEFPDNMHFSLYSNENQQASTNDKDMGTEETYIATYPAGDRSLEASFQGYPTPNKLLTSTRGNGLGVYISNYLTNPELNINGIKIPGSLSNVSVTKSNNSIKLYQVLNAAQTANLGASVRGYSFISIGPGLSSSKLEKYSFLIRSIQGTITGRQ
jgi:hypothetical protein